MRSRYAALVFVSALCTATAARADDLAACAAAHGDAQRFRRAGKLRASRERLLFCAGGRCPAMLATDCAGWLEELDRDLPTIVASAKDEAGRELVGVRVSIDGTVSAEALDGRPIPLDPGPHTIRFEAAGGGAVERVIVVKTGERNRDVSVTLAGHSDPGAPYRVAAFVLAGVGVAALATFAIAAATGQHQYDDLSDTCGTKCDPGTVDEVDTKFLVADIALGVSLASLVGSGALFWIGTSKRAPTRTASPLRIEAAVRGTSIALKGRF